MWYATRQVRVARHVLAAGDVLPAFAQDPAMASMLRRLWPGCITWRGEGPPPGTEPSLPPAAARDEDEGWGRWQELRGSLQEEAPDADDADGSEVT